MEQTEEKKTERSGPTPSAGTKTQAKPNTSPWWQISTTLWIAIILLVTAVAVFAWILFDRWIGYGDDLAVFNAGLNYPAHNQHPCANIFSISSFKILKSPTANERFKLAISSNKNDSNVRCEFLIKFPKAANIKSEDIELPSQESWQRSVLLTLEQGRKSLQVDIHSLEPEFIHTFLIFVFVRPDPLTFLLTDLRALIGIPIFIVSFLLGLLEITGKLIAPKSEESITAEDIKKVLRNLLS